MTATPRIYGEKARKKEEEGLVQLASMDNEEIYGKTLHHRGFSWAVEKIDIMSFVLVSLSQLIALKVVDIFFFKSFFKISFEISASVKI